MYAPIDKGQRAANAANQGLPPRTTKKSRNFSVYSYFYFNFRLDFAGPREERAVRLVEKPKTDKRLQDIIKTVSTHFGK